MWSVSGQETAAELKSRWRAQLTVVEVPVVLSRTASGGLAREQFHWLGTRVVAPDGYIVVPHFELGCSRTVRSRSIEDIVVPVRTG